MCTGVKKGGRYLQELRRGEEGDTSGDHTSSVIAGHQSLPFLHHLDTQTDDHDGPLSPSLLTRQECER